MFSQVDFTVVRKISIESSEKSHWAPNLPAETLAKFLHTLQRPETKWKRWDTEKKREGGRDGKKFPMAFPWKSMATLALTVCRNMPLSNWAEPCLGMGSSLTDPHPNLPSYSVLSLIWQQVRS